MLLKAILFALIGYIVGSIPWALIIGKVFYKTDIREHGSGNLGATNAGRVLGTKVFYLVAVLDAMKGFIAYMVLKSFDPSLALLTAVFTVIGHCYPLFSGFKGGKGVATSAGILLAISLTSFRYFAFQVGIPLFVFASLALSTQYISLGSMCAFISATIVCWCMNPDKRICILITFLTVFIIYKHKANIQRLLNHTENKFSLTKKK
ncbi:MAG: glycerol-3-phosphate 1-O-acyltransferase PlsY [Erysipelotrichaceae bacterium]|nr:glycerol-3-phosphate 1-O-acyltransferase PlsY [Erysipelotrichaceae bacterium]